MDVNELYLLGRRFPGAVIPEGLRSDVPRIRYDGKLGWVGEYWYYAPGSAVPGMYAKLHLPEGLVLEIRTMTDGRDLPRGDAERELTQAQREYLAQCACVMDDPEPTAKDLTFLLLQWMETHTEEEKIWLRLCVADPAPAASRDTPPPKWLVDHWTPERVYAVLTERTSPKGELLQPTPAGQRLWHLAKELPAARACIPQELEPGLPRLSRSGEHGWIVEYWYYYANAGSGFLLFTDPKYYLKVCLSTGQLLEARNLANEVQFQKSWLDVWAVWMYEKELDYLARCERILEKSDPGEDEITQLQGRWLEAHPKEHAAWLAGNSHLSEAAIRWILSPDRVPNREILGPLWYGELVKGVRLGTGELAEQCVHTLAAFGKHPAV